MPFIQQAGGTIDVQHLLQLIARYSDTPEINDIVIFMERPMDTQTTGQPMGPPNTTKTIERVGKPGMSREGASNAIQQSLLSQSDSGE
jgi:hypothetical protein